MEKKLSPALTTWVGRTGGVNAERPFPAERPIGLLACDAVCRQSSRCLETRECLRRACGEAPVDRLRAQTERNEAELERRHVPADGADAELALTEQRASERSERRPGGPPEAPAGRQPGPLLKADKAGARQRAVDPVDGRRVVTVSAQRHLEGSNTGVGRGRRGPRSNECRGESR